MEFKDVLKKLRKQRGLSQARLADELNVSPGLIGMYETGKRKPSFEQLEELADYFNVSIDYLTGKDERSLYYLTPEQAQFAQEMFEKPGQRTLFDMTKNATPEQMEAIKDIIKSVMKLGGKE